MMQPLTIFRFFRNRNKIRSNWSVIDRNAAYYLQVALLETLGYEYDFRILNQWPRSGR